MRLDPYPLCYPWLPPDAISPSPFPGSRSSPASGAPALRGSAGALVRMAGGRSVGGGHMPMSAKNGRLSSHQRAVVDPPVAGHVAFGLRLDRHPDRGGVAVVSNCGDRHKCRGRPIASHLSVEILQGKRDEPAAL